MLLKHANQHDLYLRFKAGEFDVNNQQQSGTPPMVKTDALKSLLDENPSQT
uniref:Addiction module toxin, HicA family n=1 Tax=Heterorhabditis bacteriophora TaxID=37862 RepID=A0A1I7WRS6_HETBA